MRVFLAILGFLTLIAGILGWHYGSDSFEFWREQRRLAEDQVQHRHDATLRYWEMIVPGPLGPDPTARYRYWFDGEELMRAPTNRPNRREACHGPEAPTNCESWEQWHLPDP